MIAYYQQKMKKDIVIWVTSGWVKSTVGLKWRIRDYFRRWGVEKCYRSSSTQMPLFMSWSMDYEKMG